MQPARAAEYDGGMVPAAVVIFGLMFFVGFLLVHQFWLLRMIDRGFSLKQLFVLVSYLGVVFAILARILHR